MEPNRENWSVVIIGSWNTKIFNPRWIGEKLFAQPDLQVQVLIPVIPGFPTVLGVGNIEIVPSEDSLTFRAKSRPDDSVVQEMEDKAVAALSALEHTPVRAIGANFEFLEKYPPECLAKLFDFDDQDQLLAKDLKPTQRQVSRAFDMERGVLNLTLTMSADGLKIQLNFHLALDYPLHLENSGQAIEFIKGRMVGYKTMALSILNDVYDLKWEEEEVAA